MIVCKNSDWLQKFRNCPRLTAIIRKRHTQFRGKVHQTRGKVVHFPREKRRNGGKINIFGGTVH